MRKLHLGLGALAVVSACGGSVVAEGTGGTGAGTTGTGAGTTTAGPCPAAEPTGGTSCAGVPDQLQCTYGTSVRPECRDVWICSSGSWTTTKNVCVQPAPGVCGSSPPAAQTQCANMGDVCTYGDTICFCGCAGGACLPPVDWQCAGQPTGPSCPAVVPNDGTPCSAAGVQCTYGNLCSPSGAEVTCTNGVWLWNTMIACAG